MKMKKLRELKLIRDSIESQMDLLIEELREEATKIIPEHDKFISCIHLNEDGVYSCSVWPKDKSHTDEDFYSDVKYNDIQNGINVIMEQDEYCQKIQLQLCQLNKIEGYVS